MGKQCESDHESGAVLALNSSSGLQLYVSMNVSTRKKMRVSEVSKLMKLNGRPGGNRTPDQRFRKPSPAYFSFLLTASSRFTFLPISPPDQRFPTLPVFILLSLISRSFISMCPRMGPRKGLTEDENELSP